MSAYVLIGFFIDSLEELEKLKVYGDVPVAEIPPKYSCTHLPNMYLTGSQNYCSVCGTKIKITPGTPATYERGITKYVDGLFYNSCRCIDRFECDCDKYQLWNERHFDICDPNFYYYSKDCICKAGCTCDVIRYDVPLDEIGGCILKNKQLLMCDNILGPMILYKSYKITSGQSLVTDHEELAKAKQELESIANSFNIKGKFDVKIKMITNKRAIKN